MHRFQSLFILCAFFLSMSMSALSAADKNITIWWAQWAPADGLQELGKEFEKTTGVAVTVHQIPWSSFQTQFLLNVGKAQTDFDVVVGDSQWLGLGASKKIFVDLSTWLPTAVDLASISPAALRYLCEYPGGSGKYYAAPCETDALGFAYRKDWFSDAKEQAAFKTACHRDLTVPTTWAEFVEVAKFFTRPDDKKFGATVLTGRGYDSLVMGFQPFLWQWGGSWGDEKTFKTEGIINSAAAIEALTFFKSLLAYAPQGGADLDYGKSVELFKNGSAAMSMNFFAFFPGLAKDMGDKVGFFVMPGKDASHRDISLGGQGFSVSAKVSPAQQELAKQFIAWFLKKDTQLKWITKDAGFTANASILASDAFKQASPYNGPFAESVSHLRDFWNVPQYNELLAPAQQLIGEALDGKKTPKQALDALAKAHAQIFEDAGLAK